MKRQIPPLNALRAFESAARLGRMTAAADELAVTPGAISRQVQLLEAHIGQPLFEGSKHRPLLTPIGLALLPTLSAAFDSIDMAIRAAREAAVTTLDVACFSTFTVKWLIPRLFDFHAHHPGIEIRLQTTHSAGTSPHARWDVSIGVDTHAVAGTPPRSGAVELFPEQLGPVLAPSLAQRLPLRTAADLCGHTLLQSGGRLDAWHMWASAMACPLPQLNGPVYEHYYFTLQAALAGLGVCVAPRHLVADDVHAGQLLAPLGFVPSGYRYVALLGAETHQARSAARQVFCDWLQAQATQMRDQASD